MLYSIQACRAIAALLVVCFHSAGNLAKEKYFGPIADPLERVFWFGGGAGVAFFFVLSGFIIHYVHYKDIDCPARLLHYFRKRVVRVFPTYWIVFLSVYILAVAVPSLRETVPLNLAVMFRSLLLVPQDHGLVGGTGAPVIVVAWSLQYEMLFYFIFGLALISRWVFYIFIAIISFNMIIEPLVGPYSFPRSFFANHLILLFGVGIFASSAIKFNVPSPPARWLVAISVVAIVAIAIVATHRRADYQSTMIDFAFGVSSAVLVFGLVKSEKSSSSSVYRRKLGALGDSSYALYLIHFPLVAILSKIAIIIFPKNELGVFCAFTLLVLGSVVTALGFHNFIERPMLNKLSSKNGG